MFKTCIVKDVSYSEENNCVVAVYEEDGVEKYAACTEHLTIRCGDKIKVYTDKYVNYRGYNEMALTLANWERER